MDTRLKILHALIYEVFCGYVLLVSLLLMVTCCEHS